MCTLLFDLSFTANRTEPNLVDLERAFCHLHSSPLEQKIPRYPIPRDSSHVYSGLASFGESKRRSRAPSLSSEDEEYDHIPPYLPALPSQGKDDDKGLFVCVCGLLQGELLTAWCDIFGYVLTYHIRTNCQMKKYLGIDLSFFGPSFNIKVLQ